MTVWEEPVEVPSPRAGSPDAPEVLMALREADLRMVGYLSNASNHTLYCDLGDTGMAAVYKPRAGERPLWDFPSGTLCQREVAAYVVSEALGWGLVPPTLLRAGPAGDGSVQLFIPHDPRRHYFALVEERRHHPALARIALFDLLINNTDRKGSHVLLGEADERLYGIDHGLTFHPQPKLRTVIWELGGTRIASGWRSDLEHLARILIDDTHPVTGQLCELLSAQEVAILGSRAARLQTLEALPGLPDDRRSYPWPPL
jgi:uncharacterized repeat protein (TIGR03843 family)